MFDSPPSPPPEEMCGRAPCAEPATVLLVHPDEKRAAALADAIHRNAGDAVQVVHLRSIDADSRVPRAVDAVVIGFGESEVHDSGIARAAAAAPGVPLIVVDGEIEGEQVQRVVRLGVQQHLPAQCAACPRSTALASALCWAMARHARRRELEQAAERTRFESLHDELTGLPNRRLFEDRLGHALAQARRAGGRFGLLLLDLDDFKSVNDQLGHAAGDQVLRLVAQRLTRVLRESDTVARLGGDEFVVILDGIRGRADASVIARNVGRALEQPCVVAGRRIVPRASVGIAVHPEDGRDAAALERSADAAMYAQKRAHSRAARASGSKAFSGTAGEEAPSVAGTGLPTRPTGGSGVRAGETIRDPVG